MLSQMLRGEVGAPWVVLDWICQIPLKMYKFDNPILQLFHFANSLNLTEFGPQNFKMPLGVIVYRYKQDMNIYETSMVRR